MKTLVNIMHQPDEEQYIQRYVRFQSLDVHPTQRALVVNYDVDPNMLAQLGDFMVKESRECQKVVRLKGGQFETEEIRALAQMVLQTCPLVPPTKLTEVEQLLYYLQTREENGPESYEADEGEGEDAGTSGEEQASVSAVDSYVELLYEEIPEKVRASALVLQLARQTGNLSVLRKNEILLGALARVLREDGRKSIELSTNIVHVFCCFSVFSQFHPVIAQHKVGSLCIDVVDNELNRFDQWTEEMAKKKSAIDSGKSSAALVNDYEKSLKKYLSLVKKQNQLLRVCFLLLLHMAEERKVEQKMANRGLVGLLARCLPRQDAPQLLSAVLAFLLKLSLYAENKDEMELHGVVEQVAPLIPHENSELLDAALRLLLNLSFSLESRNAMVRCGLLQKLVALLPAKPHQNEVLGILYHISYDDRCKSLFTYTDCIPLVMKMMVEHPEPTLPKYLIALAVNLAANKRNAQLMCEGEGLRRLVERAFRHHDCLLLKTIRNIAQHDGPTKMLFVGFADVFCEAIHRGGSEEFVLECAGVLGNLTIPELDYEMLLFQYDLLGFIRRKLSPQESCEDDMILEVIILAGTFCAEEVCATTLLESGIIKHVIEHLNAKQEDDEIVLHIVYLFFQLIYHQVTREVIIKETQIPGYLLDLMHDKNTEIRKLCDRSLEIISEYNEEWAKKIQLEKFRWHNCQWLEMIESQQLDEADFYGEDSYTPRIQDFLNPSDLLYGSGAYESLLSDESLSPDVLDDVPSTRSQESSSSSRPKSRYKNRLGAAE